MYTWVIDYVYPFLIVLLFLFSPAIVYFLEKRFYRKKSIFRILSLSFLFFFLGVVALLSLRHFHIHMIENICFEYPLFNYKTDIPQGCYDFKVSKYQGVGWPVTAMFWLVFEFIYLLVIYILHIVWNKVKLLSIIRDKNE